MHIFVSFDVRFAEFFLDECLFSQRSHGEHRDILANTNTLFDYILNSNIFPFSKWVQIKAPICGALRLREV